MNDATINERCPTKDGLYGTDYLLYDSCGSCKMAAGCRTAHDRIANQLRGSKGPFPLRLEIPIGLMIPDLDAIDRSILALVFYRHHGENNGISWDKNTTFVKLTGASEATISRRLDNGGRSLVTRGYVSARCVRRHHGYGVPRRGEKAEYRSSRELRLTPRTMRLINAFRLVKDGL